MRKDIQKISPSDIIRRSIKDLGGVAKFCELLSSYGKDITSQTVYLWIKKGMIPVKYARETSDIIKRFSKQIRSAASFASLLQTETQRFGLPTENPTIHNYMRSIGIPNTRLLFANYSETHPEDGVTYQAVYLWVKRGSIPVLRRGYFRNEGWPEHILEGFKTESEWLKNKTPPDVPSADDLIGETV